MKKLFFLLLAGSMLFSCTNDDIQNQTGDLQAKSGVTSEIIPGKYIVIYNDAGIKKAARIASQSGNQVIAPENIRELTSQVLHDAEIAERTPEQAYASALKGVAIELTENEADKLALSPNVKGVYPDMMVNFGLPDVSINGKPAPQPVAQSTPWGITRIGGSADGTGKTAWIIDTGIDMDHPDLTVDQTRGKNFISLTAKPDDDNGHGTHCSGIVAARNNSLGVIGVAAGATVVPIKVLDRRGSGAYSGIIAGVDYVATNGKTGDAVNMSLGGPAYQPLDDAIIALAAKGLKVALAAGNESQSANNVSPARVNGTNIFTISAMATGDLWATYSNYGNPPVDYCAPGSSIYSTYKGGGYATLSGTSMAAPHACGLLLLGDIKSDGTVSGDRDSTPDPIAHR